MEKQDPEIHDLYVRATRAQDAKRKLVKSNLSFVGHAAEFRFERPVQQTHREQFDLQRLVSSGDGIHREQPEPSRAFLASITVPCDLIKSIVEWAGALKWDCSVRPAVDDVSFVELYLHWSCFSGKVMP